VPALAPTPHVRHPHSPETFGADELVHFLAVPNDLDVSAQMQQVAAIEIDEQ
jgi:hypothetical protein